MGLTVHLDHEIERRLQEQSRASGESPDTIVNRALDFELKPMTDLKAPQTADSATRFVVKPFEGFKLPPEWTSGCVQDLLDILDGSEAR